MITELHEWDEIISIELVPEDKDEVLQLLRYIKSAKMEKPSVFFSFQKGAEPHLSIHLKKFAKSKQENFISKG